ncbi:MAG TPA: LamG-like jellyroll fold domain-containing protein, partial [Verrucomicrobiae bacterium]
MHRIARFATILAISLIAFTAQADITTGLVAYWPFDDGPGSSIATDSSGDGNNGTLTNFSDGTFASMWVPGRFGDAILLNSNGDTNDYVSVPDASSLDFNGTGKAFTIAAWVKLSGPQTDGAPILYKGVTGFEQYGLDITNGAFRCIIRNSSGKSAQSVSSTISPAPGIWYHVVAVWSATPQQHFIYINGAYNNTYAGGGFLTSEYGTNHALTIGSKETSFTSGYNVSFQGAVDDARLYSRVLTPADIYQLYTNGATSANAPAIVTQPRSIAAYSGDTAVFSVGVDSSVTLFPVTYQWQLNNTNILGATNSTLVIANLQATNQGAYTVALTNVEGSIVSSNAILTLQSLPTANTTNGLVGYWKFDDGSGSSTAADSSGNGNSGTLSGFIDGTYTTMWTNGVFDGALAFNGDATGADVVAIPNIGVPAPAVLDFSSSPALTVSAWVDGGATQASAAGIIAKGVGTSGEQYALDVFGGAYRFHVIDTNGTTFTAQSAVAPNGNWQLVTGVLNASNGILNCYVNGNLSATSVAPFSLQTNSHEVSIGNRPFAAGSYGSAFTGIIDDVKIYNRDLTSADVAALYAAKPSPLLVTWPASNYDVVAGGNAQLSPTVQGGLPPFSYQWRLNGTNIPGATANPLVLTNAGLATAGSYDLIVSDSGIVPPVTSSVVSVTIVPFLTFNGNGTTWTAQGSTAANIWQGTNIAQLTPLSAVQSNSIFYDFPVNAGIFQATFTYQVTAVPTGSTGPGEGATFCLQNDPRGAAAIGYSSSALGVGTVSNALANPTITPSVEFEMSCGASTSSTTTGVSLDTDGAIGPFLDTTPLAVGNRTTPGDPINVSISYLGGLAFISLADTNAGTAFSFWTNINIPAVLGSTNAYVGFTASTGAPYAAQQVSDFTYKNAISPVFTQEPFSTTNIS